MEAGDACAYIRSGSAMMEYPLYTTYASIDLTQAALVVKMENTTAQVILEPQAVSRSSAIAAYFARAGFTTGPIVANNFAISGAPQLFEQFFKITSAPANGTRDHELPLKALPAEFQSAVQTIVIPRRPDFGPSSF